MEQKDLAQPLEVNFEVLEDDEFDFLDDALDPYDDWPGVVEREEQLHRSYTRCLGENAENAYNIGDDDA